MIKDVVGDIIRGLCLQRPIRPKAILLKKILSQKKFWLYQDAGGEILLAEKKKRNKTAKKSKTKLKDKQSGKYL